uniref:O-acyltransferase WSD1 C-terminal domain-containing protein n=1 Tax=Neospora caninum (strain Liverpool) TaxID=572307 RepID=A0A0F7UHD2_NEOCL|nr:TPA: hypothetical protein BN1204_050930 [Neospora caninum Liverpool]
MVSEDCSAGYYPATMPGHPEGAINRCLSQDTEHDDRSHALPHFGDVLEVVTSGRHQGPDLQKKTKATPCCYSHEDQRIQGAASRSVKNGISSPIPFPSPSHPLGTETFSSQVYTPPGCCLLGSRHMPVDTPPRFYSPEVVRPSSPQTPLKKVLSCDDNVEHLGTPAVNILSLVSLQRDRSAPSVAQCDILEHTQNLCLPHRERQYEGASDEKWIDCCEVAEEQVALRVSIATPRPECTSSRWYGEGFGSMPGLRACSPSRTMSSRSLPSRLVGRADRPGASEGKRLLIRSLESQDHGFHNYATQLSTDPPLSPSACAAERPPSRIRGQQAWPRETCCFLCNSGRARSKPVTTSYEPESLTCGENDGFSLAPTTSTGTDDSNPFIYRTLPSTSLSSTGPRRRRRKASLLVCPLPPPPAPFVSREFHSRYRPSWFIHTHPQFRHSRVQTLCLFLLRVRMRLKFPLQTLNRLLQHPACFFSGNAPLSVSKPASTSWKQIVPRGGSHGVNPRGRASLSRRSSVGGVPCRRGSMSSVSSLSKQEKAARSTVRAVKTAGKRWIAQNSTSCGVPRDSEEVIPQGARSNGSEGMKSLYVRPPPGWTAASGRDSLQAGSMPEVGQLFSEPVSNRPHRFQRMERHAVCEKTTHARECRTTDTTHQCFSLLPVMLLPVTFVAHGVRSIRQLVSYGVRPRSWQSKILRKKNSTKFYKQLKFLILLVTMYPFVHGLYLPGLALIWVISQIRVACWWLYVNSCLGYRTSEQLHREWISNRRTRVRLSSQLGGNKQASEPENNEPGQPRNYITGWLCRTYVGCVFHWLFSTEPIRTITTWGCALWNVIRSCIRKLFVGMIDISFLSPSPGFGVLQWVMKWEEIGERTIEKLLHALDETVPVAAELALSIAAAITALGATDYKLVAAVDAMTEKEAVAAAQSQGSIYMTARRVGEDAAAGVDSRRREDVVKRLWRMGEGWWLSWPWRSTLVGSGHKHDNPKTKETPEKSLAQYKAGRTLLSRPPRRTEIFEVLSGQELMMFSQPLMIVSGVGFSDHLTLEDLVEVVETQLLAKKERTNVEDDVIHSESENESKPLTVYKHPRLRTVIGKLFGRYCWVRAEDFDVRNHVLKLNRHEALSLLRHHSGGLRSLHQGVLREYEQEKQRPTDEESLPSTFNSGESDGRFKDEIPCDGGNNCKCVVTSAEAQALENILATQALQPSMPLWQFVLLEHVELPALDEGGDSEKEHSDSHKYDEDEFEDLSCSSRQVGSMVMFRIHHAIADGIAITNMFLSDVLSAPCVRGSGQASSSGGTPTEAASGICVAGAELSLPPRKTNERSRAFPLQRFKDLHDAPDMSVPLSRVQEFNGQTSGKSPTVRQITRPAVPEAGFVGCTAEAASPTNQGLPTTGHEDGREIRFRFSSQFRGGDMHGKYLNFPAGRPGSHLPQGGSCGNIGAIRGRTPNSSDRTEDGPAGTTVQPLKEPTAPDRRPIKSLVPPLTRPSSIFLRALMQIISYLHVPFTVASLLMLTEEKSWDCPEKPRPPRSGSVWVLQPIRFRLQELKSLRRALAALSPPKEEKCLGDASERLQSNSDTRFCKDRLRRLSQYIVKKPLRNLLVFVARIIRPIAQGTSAYITGLERSTVKQARLGEAQDTPAEADAVDASTTVLMNKKTDSISEVEKGSRKALPKQDLFTINELLATCLVGGICRYVHNKVAMKYAIGERPETLSSKMSKSRSEVLEHPKYSSCGRQQQNNAAQQQAPVTLQATGSLNGTGQNVTDFRSDLSKVGVMTYNKSVSGLSTYSSSTCTSGHRTRAEDHITAEQERRKQILQMELDMLEQLIPQLNIVVPVNLRTTEEESFELRNNFTSAVVQVAAAHAFQAGSAYQRLLGVRKSLRKSVKSLGAHVFALMEKISFCTTPDFLLFLQIWLTKKMSVLFSNVPGPSEQPQIHGRQVHAMHFIGPLAGRISLIVSAFSYADNLDLVITTDTALLESPELLRQCILEEYRELKQLCPPTQLP